jgi:hypothetical protein
MGLSPVIVENFPGLDLRSDPGDARGAIDLMNVTLEPGRVRTREGSATFFNPALAITGVQPFGAQLIVADTTNFSAVDATGTLIAATAGVAAGNGKGAALGTPAGDFFYIATNAGVVKQWTGAAWSSPAGFPANAVLIGTMPADNRLVVADIGSKVWFSDPGAPTVYGANNFVLLTPGDSETIMAIATYNNQVFIFKKTKFFVFYGTTADAAGNPVFNYRVVDTGAGAARFGTNYHQHSVCVGDDGVYFQGRDGIYRTTGGPAHRFSDPLTPFYTLTTGPFWQGAAWASTARPNYDMAWVNSKLYVSYQAGSGSIMMVYDRLTATWSAWDFPATALCAFKQNASDLREALVAGKSTANLVARFDNTLTTDSGSAIVSRYRLPFEDYGSPRRKRLRETIIEGSGSPTVQWSRDWGALTAGSALTLGVAPAIIDQRQRLAMRGNSFSLQIGAASGAWAVNRVQANMVDEQSGPEITV